MIKSYRTAQISAQELLAQARENEPRITADLQNIAQKISAEIVGLENKFKTETSLIRKLVDYVGDDFQKFKRKVENINDVLRYTFVLLPESYSDGFRRTLERLPELDYQIPEHRIWNAWENIGTRFDKGYRGINTTIISSQKQQFELQFHTETSFVLKTETHDLYEEMRDKNTLKQREAELTEIMLKMAAKIERPNGV